MCVLTPEDAAFFLWMHGRDGEATVDSRRCYSKKIGFDRKGSAAGTDAGCGMGCGHVMPPEKRIATGYPVGVGGINGFASVCIVDRYFRRVAPDQSSVMWRVPRLARRLPDNLSTQRLTMAVDHNRHGVRRPVRGGACRVVPASRTGVPAGVLPEFPERPRIGFSKNYSRISYAKSVVSVY